MLISHPISVSKARKQFAQGLIGSWASYLGGGADVLIGMRLIFREDGSGQIEEWGFDHLQLDPNYVSVPDFHWKSEADRAIDITYRGETRTVRYDFMTSKNEYGIAELRVFETGLEPDEHGETGFWLSPNSLVYENPGETGSGMKRLWQRLTKRFGLARTTAKVELPEIT